MMGALAYALYRLGSFLSQHLPLRVSYALSDVLAELQFLVRRGPRRALICNLDVASGSMLGPSERHRVARLVFRNFGRSVVDFLRLPSLDGEGLSREVTAEGLDKLEEARESGGGMVLLTGHIGGWEVGGAYLCTLGYSVNAIAREHAGRLVTQFFTQRREQRGIRVLRTDERSHVLTDILRRGECIALLGDWDAEGRGTWATFFGRRTRVPFAYVGLVTRTGGRILPGVVLRDPAGGYCVRLGEPIEPIPGDAKGTLEGCLRVLERYISENLTQWFAFNPIWPEEAAPGGGDS